MRNSRLLKTFLLVSGAVALSIGGAILIAPEAFYAGYDIAPGGDVNLLSEMQASGGFILASGGLIVSGAFIARLALTSALVATILSLSYGLTRALGMVLHGLPSTGIILAATVELALGLAGLFVLFKHRHAWIEPPRLSPSAR